MFKEHFANLPVTKSDIILRTYNQETISHLGQVNFDIKYEDQITQLSAFVVQDKKKHLYLEETGSRN
jgi:hypothetical protein